MQMPENNVIQVQDLPGPRNRFPGDLLLQFGKDALAFLTNIRQRYGTRAAFSLGGRSTVLLADYEDIREVMVTQQRYFRKYPTLAFALAFENMGLNLFTSDGSDHLERKKLLVPGFHSTRLSLYTSTIVTAAMDWATQHGFSFQVDMRMEMLDLSARIVAKALFNVEMDDLLPTLRQNMNVIMETLPRISIGPWLARLPLPAFRRYQRAKSEHDLLTEELLRRHAAVAEDRNDVVSMLKQVRDEAGNPLSSAQLRSEAKGLFMAGHETTGAALTFALILLAQHPSEEQLLVDELRSVLENRLPTYADFSRLRYTRAIFAEVLRLFPPAWLTVRSAYEDVSIGTLRLPKGTQIFMSPWVTHRDPQYFDEPLCFLPSRWLNKEIEKCPGYFPFGMGARSCVGEGLAWLEGILVLACLIRQYRFELNKDSVVEPHALITLRLRHPVVMRGTRRESKD